MHIQIGLDDAIHVPSFTSFDQLVEGLNELLGEACYVLEHNGKRLDLAGEHLVVEEATYKVWPKVLGGKVSGGERGETRSLIDVIQGGFGSLLRSFGKQILISKNKEACRDLNGRRMRDVNNEKKLQVSAGRRVRLSNAISSSRT